MAVDRMDVLCVAELTAEAKPELKPEVEKVVTRFRLGDLDSRTSLQSLGGVVIENLGQDP